MGEVQDDELVGINPLERFSSIHLRIFCSSEADMVLRTAAKGRLGLQSGIVYYKSTRYGVRQVVAQGAKRKETEQTKVHEPDCVLS